MQKLTLPRLVAAGLLVAALAACGAPELEVDETDAVADVEQALTSCSYPSQILDLSRWKLQLPYGDPTKEVKLPYLTTFSSSPSFRSSSDCTGVRFRATTSGATTSGSEYPRTELREMKADGVTKASWSTTSGTHTMYIDAKVTALPAGRRQVIVGQIHNDEDIITIRVDGNDLYVKARNYSAHMLDSSYSLGQRFRVKLVAKDGVIRVYYNGSSTAVYSVNKSASGAYFKAGMYTQSNCALENDYGADCGTDNYGEAQIYDLWVRHD